MDKKISVQRDILLNKTAIDIFMWSTLGSLIGATIKCILKTKAINAYTVAGLGGGFSLARNRQLLHQLKN